MLAFLWMTLLALKNSTSNSCWVAWPKQIYETRLKVEIFSLPSSLNNKKHARRGVSLDRWSASTSLVWYHDQYYDWFNYGFLKYLRWHFLHNVLFSVKLTQTINLLIHYELFHIVWHEENLNHNNFPLLKFSKSFFSFSINCGGQFLVIRYDKYMKADRQIVDIETHSTHFHTFNESGKRNYKI